MSPSFHGQFQNSNHNSTSFPPQTQLLGYCNSTSSCITPHTHTGYLYLLRGRGPKKEYRYPKNRGGGGGGGLANHSDGRSDRALHAGTFLCQIFSRIARPRVRIQCRTARSYCTVLYCTSTVTFRLLRTSMYVSLTHSLTHSLTPNAIISV